MNYGFKLKNQREKAGLSQTQLAKLTGITQSSISRWEENKRTPSIENCVQLADFYGISVDEPIKHEVKKNWRRILLCGHCEPSQTVWQSHKNRHYLIIRSLRCVLNDISNPCRYLALSAYLCALGLTSTVL